MSMKRNPLSISLALLLASGPGLALAQTAEGTAPQSLSNAPAAARAPGTPTGVTAGTITPTSVVLSWTASTGTVATYRVYTSSTVWVDTGSNATTYTLTGLTPGRTYNVQVSALDTEDSESGKSTRVPVTTPSDTEAPTEPGSVEASDITANSAKLSWAAATDNTAVTGYDVLQNGIRLDTLAATATNYIFTGLAAETSYTLGVRARDAASNVSDIVSKVVTTLGGGPVDTTAPSVPTGLEFTGKTHNSISLKWDASIDETGGSGLKDYIVAKDGTPLTPVTGTTQTVTGLSAATEYEFTVMARDNAGNDSADSDGIKVTTEAAAGTPPDPPTDVYARHKPLEDAVGALTLHWTAPVSGNIAEYDVYLNGVPIDITTATSLFVTDLGNAAAEYTFKVVAVDTNGKESLPASRWMNGSNLGVEEPMAAKVLKRSALSARGEELASENPDVALFAEQMRTLDTEEVLKVVPQRPENPENVRRVERILDASKFDHIFDPESRHPSYTYEGFLRAFAKFPAACGTYTDDRDSDMICRNMIAAMVGHFSQETGDNGGDLENEWRKGLHHLREYNSANPYDEDTPDEYANTCGYGMWQGHGYPCGVFPEGHVNAGRLKSYYGRGAKQLSYNFNYGGFSKTMTGDFRTYLDNPAPVAESWLNFASAIWFYMIPQPPKPSMFNVLDGSWQPSDADIQGGRLPGFGITIMIINGECGANDARAQRRIRGYRAAAQYLGATVDEDTIGCEGMQPFGYGGTGDTPVYWDMDWDHWDWSNPADPRGYECKLATGQTPFYASNPDDFGECVKKNYPNVLISED